jgi:hypothetical protein
MKTIEHMTAAILVLRDRSCDTTPSVTLESTVLSIRPPCDYGFETRLLR